MLVANNLPIYRRIEKGGPFVPTIEKVNHHFGRTRFDFSKKMLRSEIRWSSFVDVRQVGFSGRNTFTHQHTLKYDYIYRGKGKKAVRTRLFYGYADHRGLLYTAGQTGLNDYGYDGLFLGRSESEGVLSNQFMRTQGGLALPTKSALGKNSWSFNVEFDLPIKLPISLYAGVVYAQEFYELEVIPPYGVYEGYERLDRVYVNDIYGGSPIIWNAGVSVPLIRNIFQIYVPVIYSSQIKDEFKARDLNFGETIMFELNLNMANPFEILKRLEL